MTGDPPIHIPLDSAEVATSGRSLTLEPADFIKPADFIEPADLIEPASISAPRAPRNHSNGVARNPSAAGVMKLRFRFSKTGNLRFIGHHDLMRTLERMIRRGALPVASSQGFNPRFKVVFALALGLGIEARREVVEIEFTDPVDPFTMLKALTAQAPEGLEFHEVEVVADRRATCRPIAASYALAIPQSLIAEARHAVAAFLAHDRFVIEKRRGDRDVPFDLRPFVLNASVDDDGLFVFRLKIEPGGSARPDELLSALGLRDLLDHGAVLIRTDLELAP